MGNHYGNKLRGPDAVRQRVDIQFNIPNGRKVPLSGPLCKAQRRAGFRHDCFRNSQFSNFMNRTKTIYESCKTYIMKRAEIILAVLWHCSRYALGKKGQFTGNTVILGG